MKVWENTIKPALALFALIGLGFVALSASSYYEGVLGGSYWVMAIVCFIVAGLYVLSVIAVKIASPKYKVAERLEQWSEDPKAISRTVDYIRLGLIVFLLLGSFVFLGFSFYQVFISAQSLPALNEVAWIEGLGFAVASIAAMTFYKVLVNGTARYPNWRKQVGFEALVSGVCFIAATAM